MVSAPVPIICLPSTTARQKYHLVCHGGGGFVWRHDGSHPLRDAFAFAPKGLLG